jgi:arylsulfatase
MTGHGDTVPEGLDGIDLSPTLLGHPQQHSHAYLYWEFPAYGGQQALRMGQWKAVRQQIFKEGLKTELYDLKADPSEQTNLATQYPAILAEMEKHMAEARSPSTLYPFKHLDPQ